MAFGFTFARRDRVGRGSAVQGLVPGCGRESSPVGERRASVPTTAIVMALTFGLCAGFLDSGLIVFKRWFLNPEGYYRTARDFPWSVPVGHAALMVIPGFVVAILGRLLPRGVSLRVGSWLLATVALWGALLRMPVYALGSLLLAAGAARVIADAIAAGGPGSRRLRYAPAAALAVLGLLAAASSGLGALRESRAVGALPAPSGARNVVLIVWDTVRARSLDLYGYVRETAPNLTRWARSGVTYHYALAPGPLDVPLPQQLLHRPVAHPARFAVETPARYPGSDAGRVPRLAGLSDRRIRGEHQQLHLRERAGAGIRPFRGLLADAHVDPRPHGPRAVDLDEGPEARGRYPETKWVTLQSRDAAEINGAFLDWLGRRRADRPFFAYLNYFDAHDPFFPPPEFAGRFGIRPTSAKDYQFLVDYVGSEKSLVTRSSIIMAYNCYEACIAYLDDQLDRLLDELERRGVLADTDVIITSDHGEAFVEHSTLGHGNSAKMEEIRVPLVILSPAHRRARRSPIPSACATCPRRWSTAWGSPRARPSRADRWPPTGACRPAGCPRSPPPRPSRSRRTGRPGSMLRPQPGRGGLEPGFRMSLVAWTFHYIRDGEGGEQLYDLIDDPFESTNLIESAENKPVVASFRAMLLGVLTEEPGSDAVERTYLRGFRESLATVVRQGSPAHRRLPARSRASPGRHGGRTPDPFLSPSPTFRFLL